MTPEQIADRIDALYKALNRGRSTNSTDLLVSAFLRGPGAARLLDGPQDSPRGAPGA